MVLFQGRGSALESNRHQEGNTFFVQGKEDRPLKSNIKPPIKRNIASLAYDRVRVEAEVIPRIGNNTIGNNAVIHKLIASLTHQITTSDTTAIIR